MGSREVRSLAWFTVAVVAASTLTAAASAIGRARPFPALPGSCARSDYASGGARVRAALCLPAGRGRVPAAIVLHGCGGFDTFDHRLAVELPAAGVATLYVDYFGPTPPPGRRGFCNGGGGSGRDVFAVWRQEVIAAAAHLHALPRIDASRLAVVGWSLGGGLAVSTALADPGLFRAVVGFSTGLYGEPASLAKLPPTLLLSGGPRDAIPLSATRALARALRASGTRVTLYDYGHGVHRWPRAQGSAGIREAEGFLRATLRR
jgi:dienelactone hydrolase